MKILNKHTTVLALWLSLLLMAGFPAVATAQQSLTELIEQARAAGIEQSHVTALQNRAEARGISDDELMNIIRPAIEMAEQNLPYEMVFEKAFEGISKGVPMQRMQPVLTSVRENAGRSAEFVDRWVERPEVGQMLDRSGSQMSKRAFRDQMIKASSKSLMQDFDSDALEQTLGTMADESMDRATPSSLLAAINVLSDLPDAAQAPAESARIVLMALQSGFEAGDLQKLPAAMNMAQRRSQLPATAVARGLSRQMQGGLPSEQILQNLFNGDVGGPPGNRPPGMSNERPGNQNGS